MRYSERAELTVLPIKYIVLFWTPLFLLFTFFLVLYSTLTVSGANRAVVRIIVRDILVFFFPNGVFMANRMSFTPEMMWSFSKKVFDARQWWWYWKVLF